MKLNTRNVTKKAGMTLLELTVVILVLLSLMSILFIGARAWKKGSDRAGCVMNIRNLQQAMRGHQNMTGAIPGGAGMKKDSIVGTDGSYIQTEPHCPGETTAAYDYLPDGNYPALGTLYATCGNSDTVIQAEHVPNDKSGW